MTRSCKKYHEAGFTLIEASIAMVILIVALLGVFLTFVYSISYNTGNNYRAQMLAVLQQEVEALRCAKFTPSVTDTSITGGEKTSKTVTSGDNGVYKVDITVDDDPFTDGTQINSATTLKEITLDVKPLSPTPGWQTAIPAKIILRRTMSN